MKKILKDAMELLEGLETRPEMFLYTQEAFSILVGHLFVLFDIDEPWRTSTQIVFDGQDTAIDVQAMVEQATPSWCRYKLQAVKKLLVDQGRLERVPDEDGERLGRVRLPLGLTSS